MEEDLELEQMAIDSEGEEFGNDYMKFNLKKMDKEEEEEEEAMHREEDL